MGWLNYKDEVKVGQVQRDTSLKCFNKSTFLLLTGNLLHLICVIADEHYILKWLWYTYCIYVKYVCKIVFNYHSGFCFFSDSECLASICPMGKKHERKTCNIFVTLHNIYLSYSRCTNVLIKFISAFFFVTTF